MPEQNHLGVFYQGKIYVVEVVPLIERGFLDIFSIQEPILDADGNSFITRFTLPEEAAAIFGTHAEAAVSAERRAKLWIDDHQ